jgi:ABC-2 type transport system ATP-binding protein
VADILELEGLTRRFGVLTALDNLSFSVPAGEVVGFLGPNGAGKTTTMRAVFGLTDLDAGNVTWNGVPVNQSQRRRFGYMPEERGLYPAMIVAEQVEYLGRLHGMSSLDARAATTSWLERLGVADRASSKVDALSHGNQQRVQLAAALVHSPEVLFLDEPLAGLDPTGIDAIGGVLVEQACANRSRSSITVALSSPGRSTSSPAPARAVWWCASRGTVKVPGRVASLASQFLRSTLARRGSCSILRWTVTRCCALP